MKIRAAVFCLAVAACAVAQQVPKKVYRVETSDPKDIRMEVVHGETINLQWTFLSYANPLDIESAAVTLHARTNGMPEGVSFQVPGAAGPGGVATVRLAVSEWLPASVSEAEWTLEVVQPDAARILRAKGTVTATRSAAASTNDPVPVVWLDDIRAEIGAVGAGIGPLRSRVETVEQGTNRWEAAWRWGDHSAMGYLLPAVLDDYYTMPQVDGRIADATNSIVIPVRSVNSKTGDIVLTAADIGAITNEADEAALAAISALEIPPGDRIAAPDGSRWIDATGCVWAVQAVGVPAYRIVDAAAVWNIYVGQEFFLVSDTTVATESSVTRIRDYGLLKHYDRVGLDPSTPTEAFWSLKDGEHGQVFYLGAPWPDTGTLYSGNVDPYVTLEMFTVPGAETNLFGVLATENYVDQRIAAVPTNYVPLAEKELHRDSGTNLIWKSVYSNGWHFLTAYTNTPTDGGGE